MSDREIIILAVGLVAGYVIGRAHAKRIADACACKTAAAEADPLGWLTAWQSRG